MRMSETTRSKGRELMASRAASAFSAVWTRYPSCVKRMSSIRRMEVSSSTIRICSFTAGSPAGE